MSVTTSYSISPISDVILGPDNVSSSGAEISALPGGGWISVVTQRNASSEFAVYQVHNPDGSTGPEFSILKNPAVSATGTGWSFIAGESGGAIYAQSQRYALTSTGHYNEIEGYGDLKIGVGSNADIAADPYSARYAIAWQRTFSPTDTDVYLSVRNADGSNVNTFVIDSTGANDQNASVAYLTNGYIAVAWDRIDASGHATIWEAVYNSTGGVVFDPHSTGISAAVAPIAITATNGGNAFQLTYQSADASNPNINVHYETFIGIAGNGVVSTLTGPDVQPSATRIGDDMVAVPFVHNLMFGEDVRDQDLYLGIWDAVNGFTVTDPAHPIVLDVTEDVTYDPSAASLGQGKLLVSYSNAFDGHVHQKVVRMVETVTGNNADDTIESRLGGIFNVNSGGGADTIFADALQNTVSAGAGNDTIIVATSSSIDGGADNDTVSLSSNNNTGVTISLATLTPQDTSIGTVTLKNVENLTGTSFADTLIGNDLANILDDGGGYYNTAFKDTLIGGKGNDTYIVSDTIDLVVETSAADGVDLVKSYASFVLPTFVENLTLIRGDINGTGNELANFITGSDGDNVLKGLVGADTLIGGKGNDTLDGGTNPEGAHGQGDVMIGGEGDDTYYVDSGLDLVDEGSYFPVYGFGGNDTIISTADFYWDIASVGEALIVSPNVVDVNNDGVTIVGGVFNNTLIGHKGTDVLFGRGGSDTYVGGDGVDYISLSTLGVPDAANYKADGNNIVVVDPRGSGPNSYDIIFEFDRNKDKVDVSHYTGAHDYTSGAQLLALAVNDGAGNCYIPLGDGFDYVYFVGLTKAQLLATDFIV